MIPSAAEIKRRREERGNYTSANKDIKKVMASRSKGPYQLIRGYHDPNNIHLKANDGQGIVMFDEGHLHNDINEGNITYMVNAMNSHEDLLKIAYAYKAEKVKKLKRFTPVSGNAKTLRKEIKEIDKVIKATQSRVEIIK